MKMRRGKRGEAKRWKEEHENGFKRSAIFDQHDDNDDDDDGYHENEKLKVER